MKLSSHITIECGGPGSGRHYEGGHKEINVNNFSPKVNKAKEVCAICGRGLKQDSRFNYRQIAVKDKSLIKGSNLRSTKLVVRDFYPIGKECESKIPKEHLLNSFPQSAAGDEHPDWTKE